MKTYSFEFVIPKDFVNDYIKVEADNPKTARELILKKLAEINNRTIKIIEKKERTIWNQKKKLL